MRLIAALLLIVIGSATKQSPEMSAIIARHEAIPAREAKDCFVLPPRNVRSSFLVTTESIYPQNYFSSPLDIPLKMIGSFGEIRENHFHSGIDLSTDETEGKKVLAAADGYVSRVKIEAGGFGKAIYITHPNGYVTVYAHLSKFNDPIEKYIKTQQYKNESYAIDVYPEKDWYKVVKRMVIGFSGSTGGAEGPHLHFEIRDARTEWPVNPLLFGFKIADTVDPKILRVKIYSLHHEGVVINAFENASYKVGEEKGMYLPLGPQVINVFGPIGLGVEAVDKMSSADKGYPLGIYSIELRLDGKRQYYFQFDKFSFDETRYANAHADYEEEILNDARIQRCFKLPGNKCSITADAGMTGELMLDDAALHDAEFIVKDFAGNTAEMHLALQSSTRLGDLNYPSPPADATVITERKGININTDDLRLRIPEGAVYDETWFTFSKSSTAKSNITPTYHIGDKTIAVHNPVIIEIKPSVKFDSLSQLKAVIISYGKNHTRNYEGGQWNNGYVAASVRHFGDFEVTTDDVPPVIEALEVPSNAFAHETLPLDFIIKDNLSGIDTYRATMDGKFFLLEYDAKTGRLSGEISKPKTDKKHAFKLVVTDKKGNTSVYTKEITY